MLVFVYGGAGMRTRLKKRKIYFYHKPKRALLQRKQYGEKTAKFAAF